MLSEIRTSSSKSLENAHKRMMSAPIWFIIFVGSTTLPSDLDIFLPSPSITKPCESNSLYGDTPPVATLVKIGRASCRERVRVRDYPGTLKINKRKRAQQTIGDKHD